MSQSKILERSFYPYAILLQTVPVVAVAPLIVLWFGFEERSVVIVSLIISLFPIINNTLLGLKSTSTNLVELFEACQKMVILLDRKHQNEHGYHRQETRQWHGHCHA